MFSAQQIDVRSEQAQFFVREAGSLAGEGGVAVPVLAGRYTKLVVRLIRWHCV